MGPSGAVTFLTALDHGRCSATVTAVEAIQAITLLRLLGARLRDADRNRIRDITALRTRASP